MIRLKITDNVTQDTYLVRLPDGSYFAGEPGQGPSAVLIAAAADQNLVVHTAFLSDRSPRQCFLLCEEPEPEREVEVPFFVVADGDSE